MRHSYLRWCLLKEYSVSNGNVWKLAECLVSSRLANVSGNQSKVLGRVCEHVADLIGNVLKQVTSQTGSPAPIWIGCTEARGQKRDGKINFRMVHPYSSMHSNATNQMKHKVQNPLKRETEKGASTRQAAKRRGNEKAAFTH